MELFYIQIHLYALLRLSVIGTYEIISKSANLAFWSSRLVQLHKARAHNSMFVTEKSETITYFPQVWFFFLYANKWRTKLDLAFASWKNLDAVSTCVIKENFNLQKHEDQSVNQSLVIGFNTAIQGLIHYKSFTVCQA